MNELNELMPMYFIKPLFFIDYCCVFSPLGGRDEGQKQQKMA
jgi:hypothetical protein